MRNTIIAAVAAATLAGCATSAKDITASYSSPAQYRDYDCEQIALEADHLQRKILELHTAVNKRANKDAGMMAVGMVLFWPAVFALSGGDGPEAAEYSRLLGEAEALRDVAVVKKCDVIIPERPVDPPQVAESDDSMQQYNY